MIIGKQINSIVHCSLVQKQTINSLLVQNVVDCDSLLFGVRIYVSVSSERRYSPTSAWWKATMEDGSAWRHSCVDLAATPNPCTCSMEGKKEVDTHTWHPSDLLTQGKGWQALNTSLPAETGVPQIQNNKKSKHCISHNS